MCVLYLCMCVHVCISICVCVSLCVYLCMCECVCVCCLQQPADLEMRLKWRPTENGLHGSKQHNLRLASLLTRERCRSVWWRLT